MGPATRHHIIGAIASSNLLPHRSFFAAIRSNRCPTGSDFIPCFSHQASSRGGGGTTSLLLEAMWLGSIKTVHPAFHHGYHNTFSQAKLTDEHPSAEEDDDAGPRYRSPRSIWARNMANHPRSEGRTISRPTGESEPFAMDVTSPRGEKPGNRCQGHEEDLGHKNCSHSRRTVGLLIRAGRTMLRGDKGSTSPPAAFPRTRCPQSYFKKVRHRISSQPIATFV